MIVPFNALYVGKLKMTKQEQIREDLISRLLWYTNDDENVAGMVADGILYALKQQGCVIKVEKELPILPITVTTHLGLTVEEAKLRNQDNQFLWDYALAKMLEAGYTACGELK